MEKVNKTYTLSVRLDEEHKESLEAIARKSKLSNSQIINSLIDGRIPFPNDLRVLFVPSIQLLNDIKAALVNDEINKKKIESVQKSFIKLTDYCTRKRG